MIFLPFWPAIAVALPTTYEISTFSMIFITDNVPKTRNVSAHIAGYEMQTRSFTPSAHPAETSCPSRCCCPRQILRVGIVSQCIYCPCGEEPADPRVSFSLRTLRFHFSQQPFPQKKLISCLIHPKALFVQCIRRTNCAQHHRCHRGVWSFAHFSVIFEIRAYI